jgi:hypothetical protein
MLLLHSKTTSTPQEQVLNQQGIQHEPMAAYTPEHNGTAKQFNCTVLTMAHCLLAKSSLGEAYWGEAVCMAMILYNWLPHDDSVIMPYEAWHSKTS